MKHDPLSYPYPSRRFVKYATNGMVATSQPLASLAGTEMLRRGGNAVDAAIATAAALTVVEPTSNGIGGDAFALVWSKDRLHALNGSGRAPATMTRERFLAQGHTEIPESGWDPVTVPGTPNAWVTLSERFGKLPFTTLMEPAVAAARDGYAVNPILGKYWDLAARKFRRTLVGPLFAPWFETFTKEGVAPAIGSIVRLPDHARTLTEIGATQARSFYTGALAERIDRFSHEHGAALTGDDLAGHQSEWVDPIKVNYRGHDVWEVPPNGQGIIALEALRIFDRLHTPDMREAMRQHLLIEAVKVAFADGFALLGDPNHVHVPIEAILSDAHISERSATIGTEASEPRPGSLRAGGTVYLATADRDGMMVSMIQSNYKGFGSGVVVPDTGIALHNRGKEFSLDPVHPGALAPGRRPYHTIMPGFLSRDGEAVGPFGLMGGYMQPQGHVQLLVNLLDVGMNPQAALDSPRWRWDSGLQVSVEAGFSLDVAQSLARMGHQIVPQVDEVGFGRGQVILRDAASGVLAGGSDPRTDGEVATL